MFHFFSVIRCNFLLLSVYSVCLCALYTTNCIEMGLTLLRIICSISLYSSETTFYYVYFRVILHSMHSRPFLYYTEKLPVFLFLHLNNTFRGWWLLFPHSIVYYQICSLRKYLHIQCSHTSIHHEILFNFIFFTFRTQAMPSAYFFLLPLLKTKTLDSLKREKWILEARKKMHNWNLQRISSDLACLQWQT